MLHVREVLMLIHVQLLRPGLWLPRAEIKTVTDKFIFIVDLSLLCAIPALAEKKLPKNIENEYWK